MALPDKVDSPAGDVAASLTLDEIKDSLSVLTGWDYVEAITYTHQPDGLAHADITLAIEIDSIEGAPSLCRKS
ncbi:MAG: hypothetical protein DCF18_06965 [Cyanobium sp.]|nr:MAG: hypothetical protein DCF18_06965 [Cyanobium sp.]